MVGIRPCARKVCSRSKSSGVPIDVLWFRIGRGDADDKQSLGYLEKGHALIMLDRRDYWQCAFVIEKGGFDTIKAQGLDQFRNSVATLAHMPENAVAEVDSWDKVKLLSVGVDHVRQWAKEGVLLIGDSAHAMSPIGGVGINYAIQMPLRLPTFWSPRSVRTTFRLPYCSKSKSAAKDQ